MVQNFVATSQAFCCAERRTWQHNRARVEQAVKEETRTNVHPGIQTAVQLWLTD